jgi:uncharacterized membrane protein
VDEVLGLSFSAMAEQDEPSGTRGYDVGRVLALSDGIFAIAMTLLVLSIPVPQLGGNPSDAQVRDAISAFLPSLFSFALSFLLIGMYWTVHHRTFRSLTGIDGSLMWLNLLTLLMLCLVPFSTSFVDRYGNRAPALQFYYGNLGLIGVGFWLIGRRAARRHMLRLPEAGDTPRWVRSVVPIAVFGLGILFAPLSPQLDSFVWVLMFPPILAAAALRLWRRRAAAGRTP